MIEVSKEKDGKERRKKRTWKTPLKQGTCISLVALILISPNGLKFLVIKQN